MNLYEQIKEKITSGSGYALKDANKLVYQDNNRIFKDWANGINPFGFINREEFLNSSKVYKKPFDVNDIKATYKTTTAVLNRDCMLVAYDLANNGYHPAILNLASRFNPCGGYQKGSNAQEEALCRCSNLSQSLYQYISKIGKNGKELDKVKEANVPFKGVEYPMDISFGAIYTPNVTFFRDNASNYYQPLDKPFTCGVISCAALNFNTKAHFDNVELKYATEDGKFTKDGYEIMLNKIRTILRIALSNGHDSLILGAFGCGVFKLPVQDVADQFKTVINEEEFKNKFKVISFAIMQKKRDGDKYKPFYDNFQMN